MTIYKFLSYKMYLLMFIILLFFDSLLGTTSWDHESNLDENYHLYWNINSDEILIEIQVKSKGIIGFGLSPTGNLTDADLFIGWINNENVNFNDFHIDENGALVRDTSQDYILVEGYENTTHTILQFRRKLETCDTLHDFVITSDTVRVLYFYSDNKPKQQEIVSNNLTNLQEAYKGYKSLFLLQKHNNNNNNHESIKFDTNIRILELRNQDVELPQGDDTLYWCKVFKLSDLNSKHHIIKYEPIYDSDESSSYIRHIILYECQSSTTILDEMSREQGRVCYNQPISCNAIVASWVANSKGFTFPPEAGFPMDSNQIQFYLMETHYTILNTSASITPSMVDNSGLKIYLTTNLRKHDAGVLSIGVEPNWRHIIPPGQKMVFSEGHCIEDCTMQTFPPLGINIFGVMFRTNLIGKQTILKQIRKNKELQPIAIDQNIDPNYQEYRKLSSTVKALRGDRLIVNCIYDSSSRKSITLGGTTVREEVCLALALYYPKMKDLTTCHSVPSLPTVLHSLGIEELAIGSNPVVIQSPVGLAGMTLESRLITYDWTNQFNEFQRKMKNGSFIPLCWNANHNSVPGTEKLEGYYSANITQQWTSTFDKCSNKNSKLTTGTEFSLSLTEDSSDNDNDDDDVDDIDIVEDDSINVNSDSSSHFKVLRSSVTETMSYSSTNNLKPTSNLSLSLFLLLLTLILNCFYFKFSSCYSSSFSYILS